MPAPWPAEDLERIERAAFEMAVRALGDYFGEAVEIFRNERDLAQDIAEDVLREALEAMGLPGFRERLYGKVDYKKAVYVFVPEPREVALMLDAKAEKGNGSATIQMSQTSMRIRFASGRRVVEGQGALARELEQGGRRLQVVSAVAKYDYAERPGGGYDLRRIIAACVPNGALQERYNPTAEDHIWRVGRHSPRRGEDFRVRLSFPRLRAKAAWRVREIGG